MTTLEHTNEPRAALAALSLPVLLASLGLSIANASLPAIAADLAASFAVVQSIAVSYLFAMTAALLIVGRLGDRVGRRRLLLAGIATFTLASLACGVAPGAPLLIVARTLQGLGAAILTAIGVALIGDTVPASQAGRATGMIGSISAIGTALGPSLGGLLLSAWGWRASFLVLVPLGLVSLLLAIRQLPADRGAARHVDRVARPQRRHSVLAEPSLRASLATQLLVSAVLMTTLVVGPFHLTLALGLPPAVVGLLLSVGPVMAALASVPAGRLADRVGAQRVVMAGLVATALGAALLALLPASSGVAGYLVPIAVLTTGYAMFQTANTTELMASVRADQRGATASLLQLARNLGLMLGASLMGAVFSLGTGPIATASPAAISTGMRITFAVAAALLTVALAIATTGSARASPAESPAHRSTP